jgi:hypothetical protein
MTQGIAGRRRGIVRLDIENREQKDNKTPLQQNTRHAETRPELIIRSEERNGPRMITS